MLKNLTRRCKIAQIILYCLLFSPRVFGHNEHVHQYLAIQAFELLKQQYPGMVNSLMASHIGSMSGSGQGCGDITPHWYGGIISLGAYREDCEDVVYQDNWPNVMSTHFWDADAGDNS